MFHQNVETPQYIIYSENVDGRICTLQAAVQVEKVTISQ